MSDLYDVIIIGGGPAGLTAAQYAARANLKVVVLDRPEEAGALSLSGLVENYPGLREPLSGKELLAIMRTQAERFGAVCIEEQVVGVKLDGAVKEVCGPGNTYLGKTVIVATGAMARAADIPGEAHYLGKGVSYCTTCDAAFFRGLTVCVVGDSEQAAGEAEILAGFASRVYLITPRRLPAAAVADAMIHPVAPARLVAIEGDALVRSVRVKHLDSGTEEQLATDGVFIYMHGAAPAVDFLGAAVAVGEKSCILTHQATLTSLPGVFAAGDVTCAAVRQVVVSAACGCLAALEAEKYLRQRKGHRLDWAKLLG